MFGLFLGRLGAGTLAPDSAAPTNTLEIDGLAVQIDGLYILIA